VGAGAFERFGTRSMGDDDVVRGAPQPMHTVALSLTARPHSLHVISVMVLPPKLCNQAAKGNPAGLGRTVIRVLARSTSMCKLSQYGHGLISIVVSYELVPRSILRPNCPKLKKARVFVQRSPNDCFAGSKGWPGVLAAAVPHRNEATNTSAINILTLLLQHCEVELSSWVSGEICVGIDPYMYMQRFSRHHTAPGLIYDWKIHRIEMNIAPLIDIPRRGRMRDPKRPGWREIQQTNTWHDGAGAEYILHCERVDSPPRR
jgi:hypothetical protein